jgi:hypothetical protein
MGFVIFIDKIYLRKELKIVLVYKVKSLVQKVR